MRKRVLIQRKPVVELGSGTGIAGLGFATSGGDVLLTDLDSLVDLIKGNIARNATSNIPADSKWQNASIVGTGTAAVQTLDWALPVHTQLNCNDPRRAQVIIAAETAWLKELAPLFVSTVTALLSSDVTIDPDEKTALDGTIDSDGKICYWAYKERGDESSKIFTTATELKQQFHESGCTVKEIWREQSKEDVGKWVIVNAVTLSQM